MKDYPTKRHRKFYAYTITVVFEFLRENVFPFFYYPDDKFFFIHINKYFAVLRILNIYIICFYFVCTCITGIKLVYLYANPFLNTIYCINFIEDSCFFKYLHQVRIIF